MSKADKDGRMARMVSDMHTTLGMEIHNDLEESLAEFDAAMDARRPEARPWRPEDGDGRCQACGMEYVPWFTDNALWNAVMGGPDATEDPGGYLCPRCFAQRADSAGHRAVWDFRPAQVKPEGRPDDHRRGGRMSITDPEDPRVTGKPRASWQPGDALINIHDPEYVRYARIFNDLARAPRRDGRWLPFSQRKDIAEHLWRLGYSKPQEDA